MNMKVCRLHKNNFTTYYKYVASYSYSSKLMCLSTKNKKYEQIITKYKYNTCSIQIWTNILLSLNKIIQISSLFYLERITFVMSYFNFIMIGKYIPIAYVNIIANDVVNVFQLFKIIIIN